MRVAYGALSLIHYTLNASLGAHGLLWGRVAEMQKKIGDNTQSIKWCTDTDSYKVSNVFQTYKVCNIKQNQPLNGYG